MIKNPDKIQAAIKKCNENWIKKKKLPKKYKKNAWNDCLHFSNINNPNFDPTK